MIKGKLKLIGHENKEVFKVADEPKIWAVFSETWPFGLANLFAFVYVQSDIIMVQKIAGDAEAGYYNASFIILTAILLIPSILFGKFLLPKYHRWANFDNNRFRQSYVFGNKVMLVSGVAITLVVYFTSTYFIPLIFGSNYERSIELMKLLSLSLPITFLSYSVGATLVTKSHMRKKVNFMGVTALGNIVLNLILIPKYGAYGAAYATIVSNLILLLLYYLFAERAVFNQDKG